MHRLLLVLKGKKLPLNFPWTLKLRVPAVQVLLILAWLLKDFLNPASKTCGLLYSWRWYRWRYGGWQWFYGRLCRWRWSRVSWPIVFCLKNFCTSLAQSKNFFKSHSIILEKLSNEWILLHIKKFYRILIFNKPLFSASTIRLLPRKFQLSF